MSARELLGWMQYDQIEPFGSARDNWHMAVLASLYANRTRAQHDAAVSVADFMFSDAETRAMVAELRLVAFMDSKVSQ